ncbi:MAG: Dabb family protein [Ginsengibacter sp.]
MKKIISSLSLLIICILLFQNTGIAQTGGAANGFRHIVIITFKPGASPDSIKALDKVYEDLSKSSLVKDFEWGVNVSARDTTELKHIYNTTFASKEDLDNYRKISEYKKLFQLSLPIASDVNVVDYTINK